MDASATPSNNQKGPSKFLFNLPSKGLFSSATVSSNLSGMRVYVPDSDTSPPENQLIKTDQMNILIRSLLIKQHQKTESSAKAVGTKEGSRKRASERASDGRTSTKRTASKQEGPKSRLPENLNTLTVERLRVLLRERGLSQRGRKDELIVRLTSARG
ncbi:hypothetical protein QVD17_10830 [Tagetes erecta]|uniref:SAP domain-containing protein n=1 Tax=Tagetes erecta TaxID=13708 RepID=A0AAD8L371_TARER|nr:hypothetical protein QVD17_10830 [Tagetes erecta]